VAALVLTVPPVTVAQSTSTAEYFAIVSRYRDADAGVLDRIASWSVSALEPAVQAALDARWDPVDFQAAAMLHTDVGGGLLRAGRVEEGVAHVNLAARLIDATLNASAVNVAYAVRWYAAVSELVHMYSAPWGEALAKRGGDRFASMSGFQAMARGRKQETLANTGVRRVADTPMVRWNPVADFEEAVRLDPGLHEAWLHLGRLRMNDRDAAGAVDALGRAAASPERRVRYLAAMFLGAIHERDGKFADAERAYRTAADTYPWAQSARLALAHLLSRTARETEARDVLAQQFRRPASATLDPLWTYYAAPDEQPGLTLLELRIEVMR
jgi:tetratricopeptide (TPR) repeat protein